MSCSLKSFRYQQEPSAAEKHAYCIANFTGLGLLEIALRRLSSAWFLSNTKRGGIGEYVLEHFLDGLDCIENACFEYSSKSDEYWVEHQERKEQLCGMIGSDSREYAARLINGLFISKMKSEFSPAVSKRQLVRYMKAIAKIGGIYDDIVDTDETARGRWRDCRHIGEIEVKYSIQPEFARRLAEEALAEFVFMADYLDYNRDQDGEHYDQLTGPGWVKKVFEVVSPQGRGSYSHEREAEAVGVGE